MKIGYIILCRYNSSRLPGKILQKIDKKPILKYIIERLLEVTNIENIVVATSNEPTDNPIENYCLENKINVFRGSLENVSKRFLDCAIHYNFEYATRINGDNIFAIIKALKEMQTIALKNSYDLISNLKNRTFPKGMSIEMVKTSYYKKEYQKFSTPDHFEHVTMYLYNNDENKNHYYYYNTICPQAAGIQLAIDNHEDFILAEKIISKFTLHHTQYDLADIYKFYKEINEQSIQR